MRILLIEADSTFCRQLALVLQSGGGYQVTQVPSPQQAVSVLLSQEFDLALGTAEVMAYLPVQLSKIGYGPAPAVPPARCLGWIDSVSPLPGVAEQVRQIWQRHIDNKG